MRETRSRPYAYPDPDEMQPRREASAEAALAAAVIRKALDDARSAHLAPAMREQARIFLLRGDELTYWCHIARLDAREVRELARRVLTGAGAAGADAPARTARCRAP